MSITYSGRSNDGEIQFSGSLPTEAGDPPASISGTAYGEAISGFSNFSGADNGLVPYGFRMGTLYYTVDDKGISFVAGGVEYNINDGGQAGNFSNDIIISSLAPDTPIQGSVSGTSFAGLCFVEGTLIETSRGHVAVQGLKVGDMALTVSGECRPINWIGSRTLEALPVRISAHAFHVNRPSRDLYLSPGHPVLVSADDDGTGGHLVPIMCLVNGRTIAFVPVDTVTYWHVELDQHDILLAEGLPAESYIDLGSRPWFAGVDGALSDPDAVFVDQPGRCRPVATEGPIVEAERLRLDTVFVSRLADACDWPAAPNLMLPT